MSLIFVQIFQDVYHVQGDLYVFRGTTHVHCSLKDGGDQHKRESELGRYTRGGGSLKMDGYASAFTKSVEKGSFLLIRRRRRLLQKGYGFYNVHRTSGWQNESSLSTFRVTFWSKSEHYHVINEICIYWLLKSVMSFWVFEKIWQAIWVKRVSINNENDVFNWKKVSFKLKKVYKIGNDT